MLNFFLLIRFQFDQNFIQIVFSQSDWGIYKMRHQSDYEFIIWVHVNIAMLAQVS